MLLVAIKLTLLVAVLKAAHKLTISITLILLTRAVVLEITMEQTDKLTHKNDYYNPSIHMLMFCMHMAENQLRIYMSCKCITVNV